MTTAALLGILAPAASAVAPGSAEPSCTTQATGPLNPPAPADDPFYAPPARLPNKPPGTVIRSKQVCIADEQIPVPYKAWLIMYISTGSEDSGGNPSELHATPLADAALIVEPLSNGPHPLIAWNIPEDSDSNVKAPSYTLRSGSSWDNAGWQWALAHGWEIVVPDYEGPDSAFVSGPLEGHGVLDAIRAAENFSANDGLDGNRTQVGMKGYSGGAFATAWATELAATYAPKLRIVGAAEGGVPADLKAIGDNVDAGFIAPGLLFAAAVGIDEPSGYHNLVQLDSLLNADGKALAADWRKTGGFSYPSSYPPHHIADYTRCACNPIDDPAAFPGIARVIHTIALGRHIPRAPVFIYATWNDELIPPEGEQQLVQKYCDGGASVDFRMYMGDEHVSNAIVGEPEALAYLTARFKGLPPVDTCGLPDNGGVMPPQPVPAVAVPPNPPFYPGT